MALIEKRLGAVELPVRCVFDLPAKDTCNMQHHQRSQRSKAKTLGSEELARGERERIFGVG